MSEYELVLYSASWFIGSAFGGLVALLFVIYVTNHISDKPRHKAIPKDYKGRVPSAQEWYYDQYRI